MYYGLNDEIRGLLLNGLGVDYGVSLTHKLPHTINKIKHTLYTKLKVKGTVNTTPDGFNPQVHTAIYGSKLDLMYRYFTVTQYMLDSADYKHRGLLNFIDPFKGIDCYYETYDAKTMSYLARYTWVSEEAYIEAVFENINNYEHYTYKGDYELVELGIGYGHTRELLIKPDTTIPYDGSALDYDYTLAKALNTKKGKAILQILILTGIEELITFIRSKQLKVA